jgi:protein-tyrosine phosphatase
MGFIDLHCHLLWDVDDGCRTPDETLLAARALTEAGYSAAAPSPHVQVRYGGGDATLCRSRLDEARRLLAREEIGLALHAGGENVLDDDYLARVGAGDPRGLGPTQRYALVEVPFQSPVPALPELVLRLRAQGVTPIVAHPERCLEFDRAGRAAEVVRLGGALQLNLGALTGRHGRHARKIAERLLDEGLYAVAGTDLHTPDGAGEWIAEAIATLEERAGREALTRLCVENPRRALAGEELA